MSKSRSGTRGKRPVSVADAPGWIVRAPDPKTEKHAVHDLYARVFGRPYDGHYRVAAESYFAAPAYDWDCSRVGALDGSLVTHWGVWGHQFRVGRARLRVAGIGSVACLPEFRNQGLLSKTARPSLDACREAGYDASMLFGIPDFYHRFGFVRAYGFTTFTLQEQALHAIAEAMDPEPARLADERRAEIDALYNRQNARVTGSVVRPLFPKRFPGDKYIIDRAHLKDGFYGWSRPSRARPSAGPAALAGYVGAAWDAGEHRLTVAEAVGEARAALSAVAALARSWGAREIVFETIPPRGALALALRAGSAKETTEWQANGGPMIRLFSLPRCLEKLLPEINDRYRRSPWAGWKDWLRLESAEETAYLLLDGQGVRVFADAPDAVARKTAHRAVSERHLPQLLIGTHAPAELEANGTVRFGGRAARLCEALFPEQFPAIPRLDWY